MGTELNHSEVLNIKYPEIKNIGVLYLSGNKTSYYESFYKKNTVCFEIEKYILFEDFKQMSDWLLTK